MLDQHDLAPRLRVLKMWTRLAVRALRDEAGFTLVEMLVGATIGLALVGSSVALFTTAQKSEPRVVQRTSQIGEARTFAESISRELRQGWSVPVAAPNQISVIGYVKRTTCTGSTPGPSIPCRITYACSAGACTRSVANPNGSGPGPAVRVVEGLADTNVFTYSPSAAAPSFVGIRLSFSATSGDDAITLKDGVSLRNETPPDAPAL